MPGNLWFFSLCKWGRVVVGAFHNADEIQIAQKVRHGILAAGGPNIWRSNFGNVELLRINRDGTAIKKKYRLDLSQNYSEENNPILNDGDSIWIKRNNFAKATDTLGEISRPVRDLVSIWSIFKIIVYPSIYVFW